MILVDTNVLVALVDERDAAHRTAARDLERLHPAGLAVPSVVLGEALFLLPKRHHRARLAHLLSGLGAESVELEPPWWSDVFSWLERYAEHEPDLADAVLVALVTRDARHRIWTYDRKFRELWRRPDGKALPVVGTTVRRKR